MPAAWIGAGAAAIGAIGTLSNSGGSSGAGQVAQGVGNIAGGALSYPEYQQLANSVNPFGQYNQGFSSQLAGLANQGVYGNNTALNTTLNNLGSNAQGAFSGQMNSAGQLSGAGTQLQQLLANPDSIYDTAQYKAAFGQGQNAVNSTLAAQGLNASGNQLAALQNYGQTFGQNAYNTQLAQLSGLQQQQFAQQQSATQNYFSNILGFQNAGQQANQQGFNQLSALSGLSTGSPQAAAQLALQGAQSSGSAIGQGIGQLGSGVGNLLNGLGAGGGSYGFDTGLGTTTGVGTNQGYNSGVYGVGGGVGDSGYTYGGSNTWGFTGG